MHPDVRVHMTVQILLVLKCRQFNVETDRFCFDADMCIWCAPEPWVCGCFSGGKRPNRHSVGAYTVLLWCSRGSNSLGAYSETIQAHIWLCLRYITWTFCKNFRKWKQIPQYQLPQCLATGSEFRRVIVFQTCLGISCDTWDTSTRYVFVV